MNKRNTRDTVASSEFDRLELLAELGESRKLCECGHRHDHHIEGDEEPPERDLYDDCLKPLGCEDCASEGRRCLQFRWRAG